MCTAYCSDQPVIMAEKQSSTEAQAAGSILASYPEYASTKKLDELRASQYGYLDSQGHVYLDYTGAGLASTIQIQTSSTRMQSLTCGNPHSMNPTSRASDELIGRTRLRVLQMLNASPDEYVVVFTANATAAAKLVGEGYPFRRGSRFVLTADNHNSINGLRRFAERGKARTEYVPVRPADLRIDPADVAGALGPPPSSLSGSLRKLSSCLERNKLGDPSLKRGLFAYPAQSNFSGVRHPLSWVSLAQERGYDVLLDAAAYLPTKTLDLSVIRPEFITISWYKLFGLPTGVGCLVARRDALSRLQRPWFAGGTVKVATVGAPWHVMADAEAAFEEGTVNFLSIPDVHYGLDWLSTVGMDVIATRVRCLTGWFLDQLRALEHSTGNPMVEIYGPKSTEGRGGTVSFNLLDAKGRVIDERFVALQSGAAKISLRTGCFCNPGAAEAAFEIRTRSLKMVASETEKFSNGSSIDDYLRILKMPSGGAIRVSFGIASTAGDVEAFMKFVATFKDAIPVYAGLPKRVGC